MGTMGGTTDAPWQKLLGLIAERRWGGVRNAWLKQLTFESVNQPPPFFLSQHIVEEEIVNIIPKKGELTHISTPRGSLPSIVFSEGLRWLDKALHVLECAEVHLERGLKSWSLSSAYQAGYFSQRSITSFLGVAIFEIEKTSYVVDICRNVKGYTPEKLDRIGSFEENASIYSLGTQLDQKHSWDLLKRVITMASCDLWSKGWKNHIRNANTKDITGCRHELHYKVPFWPWEDLFQYDTTPLWETVTDLASDDLSFDVDLPEYTYALTFALISMALRLFLSMAETSSLFDERAKNIRDMLSDHHPIFANDLERIFSMQSA